MDTGFFLCSIGIQLTAHILHPAQDIVSFPSGCSLEQHMFYQVGQAMLLRQFIARTRINEQPKVETGLFTDR